MQDPYQVEMPLAGDVFPYTVSSIPDFMIIHPLDNSIRLPLGDVIRNLTQERNLSSAARHLFLEFNFNFLN